MSNEQERPFRLAANWRMAAAGADDGRRRYRAELVRAGRIRNRVDEDGYAELPPAVLETAVVSGVFDDLACFVDHGWQRSVRDLFGVWEDVEWDGSAVVGTLCVYDSPANTSVCGVLDQILADAEAGTNADVGTSLVFYAVWEISDVEDEPLRLSRFRKVESCDVVFMPATKSRIKQALSAIEQGELIMAENEDLKDKQAGAGAGAAVADWVAAVAETAVPALLANSGLPAASIARLAAGAYASPAAVKAAVEQEKAFLAALAADETVQLNGGRPRRGVTAGDMTTGEDVADAAIQWFFGVSGAKAPAYNMRRFDELYVAMTGDIAFTGVFDPDRVELASASTSTLANMAVNAMNKVVMMQFSRMEAWRWYERITAVSPNDGSVQDMQWISFGGVGNLPSVAEGGAYTEIAVDDVRESDSFSKKGGYVGITIEMIKNSRIQQLQAVPIALANAALRTRSAAIAGLFTSNSGVGPTLDQDSTALFHANHTNVATTAFSSTAWRAARAECFKHTEVNSGKALGIFPQYCLVPADLYDTALSTFGYGEGLPTSYTPEAQGRGLADPRPVPLVVPDWTDATDWAYLVDPNLFPVVMMSYAQNPGGGEHPLPELYSVVSPTSGLVFTNDTLPIKVRDWFAYGVNGWRGIGKRNVA